MSPMYIFVKIFYAYKAIQPSQGANTAFHISSKLTTSTTEAFKGLKEKNSHACFEPELLFVCGPIHLETRAHRNSAPVQNLRHFHHSFVEHLCSPSNPGFNPHPTKGDGTGPLSSKARCLSNSNESLSRLLQVNQFSAYDKFQALRFETTWA